MGWPAGVSTAAAAAEAADERMRRSERLLGVRAVKHAIELKAADERMRLVQRTSGRQCEHYRGQELPEQVAC